MSQLREKIIKAMKPKGDRCKIEFAHGARLHRGGTLGEVPAGENVPIIAVSS